MVLIHEGKFLSFFVSLYSTFYTYQVLMDYAGGGNLSSYMSRKEPLQMDLMRYYSSQVLDALGYMHNKAVVHKDIRVQVTLLF